MAPAIEAFLGARDVDGATTVSFGGDLNGAFGGVFGGVQAAATVFVGRRAAEGREPAGLDCRFLRPLPAGDARLTITVLRDGRNLTCLRVDLFDERDRLATTSTVTYVEPAGLHPLDVDGSPAPRAPRLRPWAMPPGVDAPVIATLQPELGALDDGGLASRVRIPWTDPDAAVTAEAACMAADFCVGPPIALACADEWLPHPNPDLSLRFAPIATIDTHVTGIGRVVRIAGGQAVVSIDVHSGSVRYAAGAATSMVLRADP